MNYSDLFPKTRRLWAATIAIASLSGAAFLSGCGSQDATAQGSASTTRTATQGSLQPTQSDFRDDVTGAESSGAPASTAEPTEARPSSTPPENPAVNTPAVRDAAAMQNAFAQVADSADQAVVTITTSRRMPSRQRGPGTPGPFDNGPEGRGGGPGGRDPFEEFFRRFRGFGLEPGRYDDRKETAERLYRRIQGGGDGGGLGSGLIYNSDGLIMTNAHVVRGADTVTVRLSDRAGGREYRNAKVLGADAYTDIAVVKIEGSSLPTIPLGDSSKVRVGDWAIAMGNPFGLEHTLTVGVISAKAREVPLTVAGPGDYLQTDASINPGNSGGPLLDIYGRVIGVNNAIYSRTGGNVGIGFAIPINTAREIADILVKEGRVRRSRLGVGITDIDNRAAAFGLPAGTEGVLVESVEPNGPAARAGLQVGDVVLSFNGQAVEKSRDLQRLVSRAPVGSEAQVTVLRNGKRVSVTPRLAELQTDEESRRTPSAPEEEAAPSGTPTALGVRLAELTTQLRSRYRIEAERGVIVTAVAEDSPAGRVGLRPGDVIERVGQTPVRTPAEVQEAVQSITGRQSGDNKRVALYVNRAGERRFVVVNME